MDERTKATYEKLKEVRSRSDLKVKPSKYLKATFTGFDGVELPLSLRDYQIKGVLHLASMPRFLLGDDTGLGKTLQSISALAYLWNSNPMTKAVVLTTKSAIDQWRDEFVKFTLGVQTFTVSGSKAEREAQYYAFQAATGPSVLIMGYRSAVNDFSTLQHWGDYVLITDEATAYKTPTTQVHKVILWLSKKASRVWALTATLIKNNLMEGYGIYNVLVPGLFPAAKNRFMVEYCVIKMQSIGRGRQVPIIVGYRKEDIAKFREMIDPYFLGRPKHEVSNELPSLTMRDIKVAMTPKQLFKYGEATDGLLDVIKGGEAEQKETTKLTALIYCQQIVNDLALIGYDGEDSPKLDALAELLEEDLEGEKVIVFTRFKKMVDIAMPYLKGKGFECVRITGDEDATERRTAAKKFQDPKDKTRVCFITMAGSEAVNLQAAKAIIFYDSPWSAGDYLQVLGRMIRIGSQHDKVYAIHLITQGTIDGYVAQVLKRKMNLIESVLGKRLKGEGVTESPGLEQDILENTKELNELFDSMVKDVRKQKGDK